MPCFRPLSGYRSKVVNPTTGKRSIVFSHREALSIDPSDQITLPCGQCRFCRLEHSRNWAVRATNEASLYPDNCFITLTYNDENLPYNGSLDYNAPVQFMKNLRKKFGEGIRSFGCAEYGEKLSRPHYHLCLFNFDFPDKSLWSERDDIKLHVSSQLTKLWPHGFSTVGDLTFESAAYVARYVTKKFTGDKATTHYTIPNDPHGELLNPEKTVSVSRRPGLGKPWFDKYYQYLLDHDCVISRGKKVRPPKYYDRLLSLAFPEKFEEIKYKRKLQGELQTEKLVQEDHQAIQAFFDQHLYSEHGAPVPIPRLHVMEEVQEHKFNMLKRGLENG